MLLRLRCRLCRKVVCNRGWLKRWAARVAGPVLVENHVRWHMHEYHGGPAPRRLDFTRLDD